MVQIKPCQHTSDKPTSHLDIHIWTFIRGSTSCCRLRLSEDSADLHD